MRPIAWVKLVGHALVNFFEQALPVLLLDAHFLGLLFALCLFLRADAEEANGVRRALLVGAHVELAACLFSLDHNGGGGCRALARALGLVVSRMGTRRQAGP